jgi:hypothetical protein
MEHAEAHERLSDLALEPRRLAALAHDASAEAVALREHLARCDRCAADLASWQRTWTEIGLVSGRATADATAPAASGALGADVLIEPPAGLRERVLGAAAGTPASGSTAGSEPAGAADPAARPHGRDPRRSRLTRAWLVAAAAVIVALLASASSYLGTAELDRLRGDNAGLAAAAATLDRVFAAERFWTVTLRTADGSPGGTLAWSAQEVVVVTSRLPAPGAGQSYRCWLERDGARTGMGEMAFSGSTGYWAGSLESYGQPVLRPGGRFGVSLVPAAGVGTPVLVGEL